MGSVTILGKRRGVLVGGETVTSQGVGGLMGLGRGQGNCHFTRSGQFDEMNILVISVTN